MSKRIPVNKKYQNVQGKTDTGMLHLSLNLKFLKAIFILLHIISWYKIRLYHVNGKFGSYINITEGIYTINNNKFRLRYLVVIEFHFVLQVLACQNT